MISGKCTPPAISLARDAARQERRVTRERIERMDLASPSAVRADGAAAFGLDRKGVQVRRETDDRWESEACVLGALAERVLKVAAKGRD